MESGSCTASEDSDVLGYTTRVVGNLEATEVWGELYAASGDLPEGIDAYGSVYMPWIKSDFHFGKNWVLTRCSRLRRGWLSSAEGCCGPKIAEGYITETNVAVERYRILASQNQTPVDGGLVQSVSFRSKKTTGWRYIPTTGKALLLSFIQPPLLPQKYNPGWFSLRWSISLCQRLGQCWYK